MSDKKIIKYINKNRLDANSVYNDPLSGRSYMTNKKGKFKNFMSEEDIQIYLQEKQVKDDLKRVDEKARDLLVTERAKAKVKKIKTKEKLKGIKEDPTLQKNKLEDAYLKYDEEMLNLSEVLGQDETPETPEQRIAYRKKNTAMRNLFDTAKAISGINKTDEYAKAFQYVNEPSLKGEELDSETLYKSEGPIKSLSWKGKQQDEYRTVDSQIPERKNIKDLSDEELIKRLKL